MAKFIPFPAFSDFAPIDISYLFENEKPAGKHGFLRTKGDEFVFEDGTHVKFWGCNLNSACCFPSREYAPKLAKRIAAYGCNIVRLHQIDSEFTTPNIYQLTRGKRMQSTRQLCVESLDLLDYFIYCLQREGIYIYMDNLTFRKFRTEDGVVNAQKLGYRAAPYCLYDRKLIELQKEYMDQIWNHVNPYLGLANKDNPQIVMTDVNNESDLFGCFNTLINVEPYVTEFRQMLADWLQEQNIKTIDPDTVDINDLDIEEVNDFKYHLCNSYYTEMFDHLKSIGVRIPMTGINYSWRDHQCKAAQSTGDFADSHLNIRYMNWNPGDKTSRDIGFHEQVDWGGYRNVQRRHFGKPFFTSEWDLTYPNKYRAESAIVAAAVGLLQNWSGYCIHTYSYLPLQQHMTCLGKEVNAEAIGNTGYREGIFSTWNDPAKFGMFYHASIMTRRGDVKPANNKIIIAIKDLVNHDREIRERERRLKEAMEAGLVGAEPVTVKGSIKLPKRKAVTTVYEVSQIGVDYLGEYENTVSEHEYLVDLSKGDVTSDTGELYRSWEKCYGVVDTPMTKAVYGRLGSNDTISMNAVDVTCSNPYATVALSSLNNDLPIEKTDAMLLTAVGRVENTGFVMKESTSVPQPRDGHEPYMELVENGTAPILCEVIEADICIKTHRKDLVVWAVSPEGAYIGNVPTKFDDEGMHLTIGTKHPSIYYIIQAE